jgi:hypothetical protein
MRLLGKTSACQDTCEYHMGLACTELGPHGRLALATHDSKRACEVHHAPWTAYHLTEIRPLCSLCIREQTAPSDHGLQPLVVSVESPNATTSVTALVSLPLFWILRDRF